MATKKMNEKLERYINDETNKYNEREISEMKKNMKEGYLWHGCKTKGAFKKCGMADEYEDYNLACEFVHVRDYPFPAGLLPNGDRELTIQFEFNNTLSRLASYLEDFIQFCPNTFSNGVDEKLKEIKNKIDKLTDKIATITDPEMGQFIGISDLEYK